MIKHEFDNNDDVNRICREIVRHLAPTVISVRSVHRVELFLEPDRTIDLGTVSVRLEDLISQWERLPRNIRNAK